MRRKIRAALLGALLAPWLVQASAPPLNPQQQIEKKVRHELLMLPYYNVFDNLAFAVEGNRVVLSGQVTRPVLKSDAENAVKHVEGVQAVENRIEVLPLSPFDSGIRWRELRAIYSQPILQRYAWGPLPPIHIIVRNGVVTLEGVVDNQTDKNVAGIQANGVPGVFKVINNLRVVKS